MKILIYTPQITPRIRYIFSLFFTHLGTAEYIITDEPETIGIHKGPIINYSATDLDNILWFPPSRLLFESGIKDHELELITDNDLKGSFAIKNNPYVKFDIFASAFYLVTRYEEYLPHLRDLYNRFSAKYSFAYQHGFLQKPMINYYSEFLYVLIEKKYPDFKIKRNKYEFLNTIDIDNAWAYKEKGVVRTVGAIAKDIVTFNFKNLSYRLNVFAGNKKDPYDNYVYFRTIKKKYRFNSLYFILLGDYGLNDKNIPVWNKKFRSLIQSISDYAEVGIHPSFGSNSKPEKLKIEIKRLSNITKFEITKSRQHFLILNLPETYQRLIENEITDDYTMGFATEAGFRASICVPYPFYDLDREEITTLMIHPFAFMDATLKYYMKLTPDQSFEVIDNLINEVKKVNGVFMGLWHNETVSDEGLWKGWRKVYEFMIIKAIK
jgi:hypothetical protein